MSKSMDAIATINSLLRTLLAVAVVGTGGYVGWRVYSEYAEQYAKDEQLAQAKAEVESIRTKLQTTSHQLAQRNEEVAALRADVERMREEIDRLDTSLRLLKVDHRVARLRVIRQTTDETSGDLYSEIEFTELGPQGETIGEPRRFRIRGDVVYIDNWVVKFEDKYVERAEIDRSTSLVLFRRLFGEYQEPREGFPLDEAGGRPQAYGRGGEMSDFERQIWDEFWLIANDPRKAAELGIRAAHGEAPSIKVQEGRSYRIVLRASDGLTITPEPDAPPIPPTSGG